MPLDRATNVQRDASREWRLESVSWPFRDSPELLALPWHEIPSLPPLVLSDGTGRAEHETAVKVCADRSDLMVRFDCDDPDIWGSYGKRDDPLYLEEAVEVFLAPGDTDPLEYFEFEVSPNGVLFDARVRNPSSRREDLESDPRWDCPGIRWAASIDPEGRRWSAALAIPWGGLGVALGPPPVCRANFYRIERPRGREPEFSAWSPTFARPADFHKPEHFGRLVGRTEVCA